MEGTVTLAVKDYDILKKYEDAVNSQEGFFVIYRNGCSGRNYVSKEIPERIIREMQDRIKFLEGRIDEIIKENFEMIKLKQHLETKDIIIGRLEDTCKGYHDLFQKNQNKTFFQKLFGS